MPKNGGPASGIMLGLDLGSKFIKVAEISARGGELELLSAGILPTPSGLFSGDAIIDPQGAAEVIKALLQQVGVHTNKVVISAKGQTSVVVRIIEVPKMREEELADAMKWEIERHVPFAATGAVTMDYAPLQPMDTIPEEGTGEVLMAVAEEGLINALVDTVSFAGLEPVAIDIEPLALGRCFVSKDPQLKNQTIAILQMGARSSELTIIVDDNPRLTRSLTIGGNNLTSAVGNALGVSDEEAEKIKKRYATIFLEKLGVSSFAPSPTAPPEEEAPFFPFSPAYELPAEEETPPPPKEEKEIPTEEKELSQSVFEAILPVLGDMVNELRRSFEYIRQRTGEMQIDKMVVSGGGALIKNIDKFFSQELAIPVEIGNSLKGLKINPRLSPLYLEEISPLFSVAIGLAIRDFV
ncbi:MAG: type IV pilus assembly protein PilM [bacterium]